MDTGVLIPERVVPSQRLAGEIGWCLDAEGRVATGRGVGRVCGWVWASGRVCPESGIGVIETVGGRAAVLGLLPRSVVDVLAARFPGVRWAVADVVPSATAS
jgi:hypothetical protein